jgi:hypothetical protein
MLIFKSETPTISFLMVSSADGKTPIAGQAANIQVQLSKKGASFANASGSVSEIGSGWYKVTLSSTETNTVGQLIFRAYDKKSTVTMFTWSDIHEVQNDLAARLSTSEKQAIADHVLRRAFANAAASSDGDAKSFRSLLGVMAKAVNKTKSSSDGTKLEIYEANDSTLFGQQAFITGDGPSAAVTGLDTI